ncbi:(5-formylfuran-3-yl)methyl phosphate synthase [Azospirillum sp. B506]|uniref:(5-formylfuran-3-yl)methyl phosphate synthase n=1 Tax=Azospirillum sp. B506 TaxID=137721 RepID=UPI000349DD74|nr:(5-formylfuran-3-yl)methyl phosphate synthase [Azospirillum sp. B506]
MIRMLASVTDPVESEIAVTAGADLIDLKNPDDGALGALPVSTIRSCLDAVAGRRPVSATIGDLPMEPACVADAVSRTAATGVDIVKMGILAGGDPQASIAAAAQARGPAALFGVILADMVSPTLDLVRAMAGAGFIGVMLDTGLKDGRTLRDHLSADALAGFIGQARDAGLSAGLAGSLRLADIGPLAALHPSILGFRGALCRNGARRDVIDQHRVAEVVHGVRVSSDRLRQAGAPDGLQAYGFP